MHEKIPRYCHYYENESSLQLTSRNWLLRFGLRALSLDKMSIYKIIGFPKHKSFVNSLQKMVTSRYGNKLFGNIRCTSTNDSLNLIASIDLLRDLRSQLISVFHLYERRFNWLLSDSRLHFGFLNGHTVGLLIYNGAASIDELALFYHAVGKLLDEQCLSGRHIFLKSYGKCAESFSDKPIVCDNETSSRVVDWLLSLQESNRLREYFLLDDASPLKMCDSIYLLTVGNSILHKVDIFIDQFEKSGISVNLSAFALPDARSAELLKKKWLRNSLSSFHANIRERQAICSQPADDWVISIDSKLLVLEMEEARQLSSLVSSAIEFISSKLESGFNHERMPLKIIPPSFTNSENNFKISSRQWLADHGLSACKLDFYTYLEGMVFPHCEGPLNLLHAPQDNSENLKNMIVPPAIIHRTRVEAMYCENFSHIPWKDGTIVHAQISPTQFMIYKSRMQTCLARMKRRISQLYAGSQELFGPICENNVCILIDTSISIRPNLNCLKRRLILLLEEQICFKKMFNLIAFNTTIKPWRESLKQVSKTSIESARKWIAQLKCEGSTNTLKAIEFALYNREVEGIYLITDGRPNQPIDVLLNKLPCQSNIPIHTISFNCIDLEANDFLAKLAALTGATFHSFREDACMQTHTRGSKSENIRLIEEEIDLGREYLARIREIFTFCQKKLSNVDPRLPLVSTRRLTNSSISKKTSFDASEDETTISLSKSSSSENSYLEDDSVVEGCKEHEVGDKTAPFSPNMSYFLPEKPAVQVIHLCSIAPSIRVYHSYNQNQTYGSDLAPIDQYGEISPGKNFKKQTVKFA